MQISHIKKQKMWADSITTPAGWQFWNKVRLIDNVYVDRRIMMLLFGNNYVRSKWRTQKTSGCLSKLVRIARTHNWKSAIVGSEITEKKACPALRTSTFGSSKMPVNCTSRPFWNQQQTLTIFHTLNKTIINQFKGKDNKVLRNSWSSLLVLCLQIKENLNQNVF